MSSTNNNPDLKTRNWLPYQRNLIYLVKANPITYYPSTTQKHKKLDKTKWDSAWMEIGSQLCQPGQTCKRLWTKIKFSYAKLKILINTGKITKEAAISHPETGRFFDGLLSFIDPFISQLRDEDIPFSIHKSINAKFCLKTKRSQYVSNTERHAQFVTHAQVKALLKQRQSIEEQNLDIMEPQYLQISVDCAIKRKLEQLLPKKVDLSNLNNDTINTRNVPETPSIHFQNVDKRTPNYTLVPSKNILNNDEENTTKAVNLGLATELIIEDDIKRESEADNIKMEDDNDRNEENLTLVMNINNRTEEKCDLVNILPSTQIIKPAVQDTIKSTISSLNNDVIDNAHKTDNIVMTDNSEPPISDDYIKKFFNELGIVMSLELSISKQKTLKSRINELLKDMLLKEGG